MPDVTTAEPPSTAELDLASYRRALGSFPTGVVAVAATVGGRPVGLAASSFVSVSLDPRLVSVSIAAASATWPLLRTCAGIGLSVLADHHEAACRRLAGPAAERFRGLPLRHRRSGAILIEDAVATFECRRVDEVPAGDHVIVILEPVRFSTPPMAAPPLVHHRGALATVTGVP
jgi:flavin reductase (DIM6/NTAB) family NADH-FMN oxidoreductase RutF